AVELIDAEIAQSFSQQRKKREGGGPTYHETFAYAQGPFARVPEAYVLSLGIYLLPNRECTRTLFTCGIPTIKMWEQQVLPTTELGSEDTVIAQFLRVAVAKNQKYPGENTTENNSSAIFDGIQVIEPNFGLIDKPDADTNDMISEKLMVQINLNEGIEEDIPPSQYTTRCEEKLTMTQAAISREAGPPCYDPGENFLQTYNVFLSCVCVWRHGKEDGLLHTACGTPNYVASEVLADKGYDGMAADVWSCGIILFVLMAGYLPFDDANLMGLYKLICHATFSYPPWFSFGARKFIKRILDPNPDTRIKIAEILEDEWFKKGYKPPHFEQGEDVNLDDVDAALIDSE
ncbi:hypothetical protein ACJX0J_041690, partial [Zea mays]